MAMDVLIAFVTTSDPWSERMGKDAGPAGTVTAAKALLPEAVYLLHTNDTAENMRRTKEFLERELTPCPRNPEAYKGRMECLDLRAISYFQDLAKEKFAAYRLRLKLILEEAYLDGDKKIDIRSRSGAAGGGGQL